MARAEANNERADSVLDALLEVAGQSIMFHLFIVRRYTEMASLWAFEPYDSLNCSPDVISVRDA